MTWWPDFLAALRFIISFFRNRGCGQVLRREAETQQHDGSGFKVVPPSFAKWRWGTLKAITTYCCQFDGLLQCIWDKALLHNTRGPTLLNEVDRALLDKFWWEELRVVTDLVNHSHSVRTWGSGCACLEVARLASSAIRDCPKQGRRLPDIAIFFQDWRTLY